MRRWNRKRVLIFAVCCLLGQTAAAVTSKEGRSVLVFNELGFSWLVVPFTIHNDIPRSLLRDTSLCGFQMLKESLHIAVKHSGMPFNTQATTNNLVSGLIRMRGRASVVSGGISITSKRMGDTEIRLRVPIAAAAGVSSIKLPSQALRGAYEIVADLVSG